MNVICDHDATKRLTHCFSTSPSPMHPRPLSLSLFIMLLLAGFFGALPCNYTASLSEALSSHSLDFFQEFVGDG